MFNVFLHQLAVRERQITLGGSTVVKESSGVVQFLKDLLERIKEEVLQRGFADQTEGIHFFREV